MNLERVTITGADDQTSIEWMLRMSERYQFVEWGILVSASQEGGKRFPSRNWIEKLVDTPGSARLQLATHLCGRWVRELLIGELDWSKVPPIALRCNRIQINTHGGDHVTRKVGFDNMQRRNVSWIWQWDGVNDHHAYTAKCLGLRTEILFDTSAGAGILPAYIGVPSRGERKSGSDGRRRISARTTCGEMWGWWAGE